MWRKAEGANIGRRGHSCGATPTARRTVRPHLSHTLPHSAAVSDGLQSVGNDPTIAPRHCPLMYSLLDIPQRHQRREIHLVESSLLAVADAQRCWPRVASSRQKNYSSPASPTPRRDPCRAICRLPVARGEGRQHWAACRARGAAPNAKTTERPQIILALPTLRRCALVRRACA